MLVFNKTVFLLESGLGLDPWLLYPSPKGTHSPGCPCLPTGSSAPAHGPESHIISLCPEMLQKGKAPAPHSPAHVPEATKHSPLLLHKALPASPFLHARALPAPSTGGTEICMPGHGAVPDLSLPGANFQDGYKQWHQAQPGSCSSISFTAG